LRIPASFSGIPSRTSLTLTPATRGAWEKGAWVQIVATHGEESIILYGGTEPSSRHDSDAWEPKRVEMKSRGHEINDLVADALYGGGDNAWAVADNGNEPLSPFLVKNLPPTDLGFWTALREPLTLTGRQAFLQAALPLTARIRSNHALKRKRRRLSGTPGKIASKPALAMPAAFAAPARVTAPSKRGKLKAIIGYDLNNMRIAARQPTPAFKKGGGPQAPSQPRMVA
jgi:hypothetical protein